MGDNSMLILLFSVLTIALTVACLFLWWQNLKSAVRARELAAEGKHVNTFAEDFRTLLNERFHITLLTMPMITLALFTVLPIVLLFISLQRYYVAGVTGGATRG